MLMQALHLKGFSRVDVVDLHEQRLNTARKLGAAKTFGVPNKPEGLYDLVVDATGSAKVVQSLTEYVATSGTVFYFGVCDPDAAINIKPYDVFRRDLKIVGSFSLCKGIPQAIQLLRDEAVLVDSLLTHQFPLEDFEKGLKLVGNPKTLKIVGVQE